MTDEFFQFVGIVLMFLFIFVLAFIVWSIYIERFTHDCFIKIKLRENGHEYRAVRWRQWKGFFYLYVYNPYTEEYNWMSVLLFENSEKIINQLTKSKK